MKKTTLIMLLATLLLVSGLVAKPNPAKDLQNNLKTWQQFRWEGIIQVQMEPFSARKNFVFARNQQEMRLDVLDSGVMGLQAKPLATLYLKDKILLDAPSIQQLADIDLNWFIPTDAVRSLVHFADSLKAHSQEILANRKVALGPITYNFDKKHRLVKISSPDFGMKAEIIYNRRNQPTKMLFDHEGERIVELQINQQKYGNIKIIPLLDPNAPLLPETPAAELTPSEGKFFELNLDDPHIAALLDSLKLSEVKLGVLLDSLKLGELNLKDLGLDSLKLDSLQLDMEQFKGMNLDQLMDKLNLNDITLKELLKDLHPEDIKLEDLLKGMNLQELNLDQLGIQLE